MTRSGFVFAAATMAYGVPCLPPPMPKNAESFGWHIASTEFHQEGVTIVWKIQVAVDVADGEKWLGTGG